MAELARVVLIVAVAACALVSVIGVLRGEPAREMLSTVLTLGVATIPEGCRSSSPCRWRSAEPRWRSMACSCAGCAPPKPSER